MVFQDFGPKPVVSVDRLLDVNDVGLTAISDEDEVSELGRLVIQRCIAMHGTQAGFSGYSGSEYVPS